MTALVEHLLAEERQSLWLKWTLLALAIFTVVLLGAMTGLTYAVVAKLKDTKVNISKVVGEHFKRKKLGLFCM